MTDEYIWQEIHAAWLRHSGYQDSLKAAVAKARELMCVELPPICGMSVEDLMLVVQKANSVLLTSLERQNIAQAMYDLAQPVPKPDPDAMAKEMAFIWHKSIVSPGQETPDDYWQICNEKTRMAWRAVAAMEKGDE